MTTDLCPVIVLRLLKLRTALHKAITVNSAVTVYKNIDSDRRYRNFKKWTVTDDTEITRDTTHRPESPVVTAIPPDMRVI